MTRPTRVPDIGLSDRAKKSSEDQPRRQSFYVA
jgi:hypothetical protein